MSCSSASKILVLSLIRAAKAQTSLRAYTDFSEHLVLAHINYRHLIRLRAKSMPLDPLDSCAYMFKEYAFSTSTKTSDAYT